MAAILQQSLDGWAFFLLVFARIISMLSLAPIFGGRTTPGIMRIGLAGFLSLSFSIILPRPADEVLQNLLPSLLSEVLIGLGIGYVAMLFFNAVQMAGHMIDVPMGFSMVNVFDPQSDTQLPVIGDFYYVLAMLLFLATNSHHMLLMALRESYQTLGLGRSISTQLLPAFTETFARMFLIGVKISIPTVAVMLMCDVAMALLARTVPSLNAFILGAPVKIALGVLVMLLTLTAFIAFIGKIFLDAETGMFQGIISFLRMLGGGA